MALGSEEQSTGAHDRRQQGDGERDRLLGRLTGMRQPEQAPPAVEVLDARHPAGVNRPSHARTR
jgi:hypothetical protein